MNTFDALIYNFFVNLQNPTINWIWVFFAKYGIYIILAIAIYILFKQKKTKYKIYFALQSLLLLIVVRGFVSETISFFFNRQRPFETGAQSLFAHSSGYSFPSGHTVTMFLLAFVVYKWNTKLGKYSLIIALISGISRAVSGVHWLSDIAGGLLIAWIGYILIDKFIFEKINKEEEKKIESETI